MTDSDREDIHEAAAAAALGVPGVAALQPSPASTLVTALLPKQTATTAGTPASWTLGLQSEYTPAGWDIEVRCILHADRRAVDVAREVREAVRSAITGYLVRRGENEPVTVRVTVTRTV
ncbi:hypothetical protein [Streptomyces sp. NBC_01439]|uniref:hypothetical protein n=1 Tax=Streptomyces sp. NBC_01439 TaxID=2903867 RepID=UPI002E2CBEA8|nr:hypothetical protein [Streptomyces sp. NBC_01439]